MSSSTAAPTPCPRNAADAGDERTDPALRPGPPNDSFLTYPAESGASAKELVAAGTLFCISVSGAVLSVLDKNPFWFLVALWAMALVFAIAARGRMDITTSLPCLALAVLPFPVGLLGAHLGIAPFPMDTTGFKLLDSVSLFALCLGTSLYIGTLSTLRVNRKFVIGLAFVIFVALLTVRGPIGFYGDLIFRTEHIISNASLMSNLIFCSFIGLVLALVVNRRLRRNAGVGAASGEASL